MAPYEIQDLIESVVTIDSPLLGHSNSNPLSHCDPNAQSWRDILGTSDTVKSIKSIQGTSLANKFIHLNSTDVGDSLAGGRDVDLECGAESAQGFAVIGSLLGTLITGGWGGLVAGALGGEIYGTYGPGHNCGFYDPEALKEIADAVRR